MELLGPGTCCSSDIELTLSINRPKGTDSIDPEPDRLNGVLMEESESRSLCTIVTLKESGLCICASILSHDDVHELYIRA